MKEEQKGEILIYQSSKSNISEHIKHIFEEGELSENSVVRKFRTTQKLQHWVHNAYTIGIHNPNFKVVEFDHFKH